MKQVSSQNDAVNNPQHYTFGKVEVIDVIEDWTRDYPVGMQYHIGAALKYLARGPHKHGNPREDLEKAIWYLRRAIRNIPSEQPDKSPTSVMEI